MDWGASCRDTYMTMVIGVQEKENDIELFDKSELLLGFVGFFLLVFVLGCQVKIFLTSRKRV